ncbi:MAG: hypothetical protein ACO1OB_00730 [Archangium sp.]
MLLALTLSLALGAEPEPPPKPISRAWGPATAGFITLAGGATSFTVGLIFRGENKEPLATSLIVGGVALMSLGALAELIAIRVWWSETHPVQVALGPNGFAVMGRF